MARARIHFKVYGEIVAEIDDSALRERPKDAADELLKSLDPADIRRLIDPADLEVWSVDDFETGKPYHEE